MAMAGSFRGNAMLGELAPALAESIRRAIGSCWFRERDMGKIVQGGEIVGSGVWERKEKISPRERRVTQSSQRQKEKVKGTASEGGARTGQRMD